MGPAVDTLRILTAVRGNRAARPGVATAADANALGAAAMAPAVDMLRILARIRRGSTVGTAVAVTASAYSRGCTRAVPALPVVAALDAGWVEAAVEAAVASSKAGRGVLLVRGEHDHHRCAVGLERSLALVGKGARELRQRLALHTVAVKELHRIKLGLGLQLCQTERGCDIATTRHALGARDTVAVSAVRNETQRPTLLR
jgi:hypothetical protein